MKSAYRYTSSIFAIATLAGVSGCAIMRDGSLEVLNPKQAYGKSSTVVSDVHRENEAIERRLASDLQEAFSKHGLTVAEDPAKADLVVVPTLGRMRERTPTPTTSVEQSAPSEASEPVVAAPVPEAREFNRFSGNTRRSDISAPRITASARIPAAAQQAGLLLTAYRAEDFRDYGIGRQSLPPVWRIYVSQPAVQMKWKSVAVPLINAAASAAAPLGKVRNEESESRKEEPAADQTEPPAEKAKSRERGAPSAEPDDSEAPAEKRKFLGLFGGLSDREKKPEAGN